MGETETTERRSGSLRTLLLRGLLVLLCLTAAALLSLKIYLNSSHAPRLLSAMLTDYLRQPVRVSALRFDGGTFSLSRVALGNPPDLAPGDLCRVDTLTIAPNWGELLLGRRSLRLLSLDGLRVDLRRNSAGVWNFTHLQRLLAAQKPSGAELFIRHFHVRDGALSIDGQGVRGLDLRLTNLTTKGNRDARLQLSFLDPGRNRYTVEGSIRAGREPALELTLSAPSLSPAGLAGTLGQKNAALFGDARASLRMDAALAAGRLRLRGRLGFSGVPLAVGGGSRSLNGRLEFSGAYDTAADRARLESLTLTLDNRVAAHAAATLDAVRTTRRFGVDLGIPRIDLAELGFLLPESERRRTVLTGSLSSNGIHLAGDATRGVIVARGAFLLQNASLERDARPLFRGVNAPLTLSRVPSGFLARGRLSRQGRGGGSLLEALEAPFQITLSNRLRLIGCRVPELTARVMGISVSGQLGLEPAAFNPLSATLRVAIPSFSRLEPLGDMLGLKMDSGSGSLSVRVAGRGARDFDATAAVSLSALRGTRSGRSFGMGEGVVDARIVRKRGVLSIDGTSRLNGMKLDGRGGDARFSYAFSAATLRLRDARILVDGTSASFSHAEMRLPVKETKNGIVSYPLSAQLSGGVLRRGEAVLDGFSLALRGELLSAAHETWMEGGAELAAGTVSWQGKPVGAPGIRLAFSRPGARGELAGTLLGGTLSGSIAFNPSAPGQGGTFRFGLAKARVAMIGDLLPRRGGAVLSSGTVDGTINGGYSTGDGLTCRFESAGNDVAASGSGNRTLFSNAGYRLSGSLSGNRLQIGTARFTVGPKVGLRLRGELTNPLSRQRQGRFSFSLPRTPLNDIIDPFVNMLPRLVQEAAVDGSLGSEGNLVIQGDRNLLEGALRLDRILLDLPSQNIRVTDINGTLPFSLDLSGATPGETRETARFSRENYPQLLEQLRGAAGGGQSMTLGSVSFGPLSMGETRLKVSAADGVTRVTSLRSSLYEGALLGSGSVTIRGGVSYRTDLLINGLSLKLLCASIPAIKDYISGRVDGLISLGGTGTRLSSLIGFTELWAREGGGEKMLVSRVFLQKLSGKNLSGFFFRNDRPFDQAEIAADLEDGFLTFETLDISHTNLFGVRDLSVIIAPSQNRIALDHLFNSIRQAATRGKAAAGAGTAEQPATAEPEFKWED